MPPPAKKLKAEASFFDDLYATASNPVEDEVDTYLAANDVATDDILTYWQSKSAQWPRLSKVVKTILAIPATETSSERVFSIAGRTIEDRRTQLNSDTVDDLLFLHGLNK